jgi:metallo-beta-lactamase class B
MHITLRGLLIAFLFFPVTSHTQPTGWNDPFPAHKIMDNLYYVGTTELSSWLITTEEGNILISSNYASSVPVIKTAVESLGFSFSDIKILISGHAHPDHIEGDRLVKNMTGATVLVGRLEAPIHEATLIDGIPLPVDRLIDDGDEVTLGSTTLTAHVQPGHTKGCLAWSLPLRENNQIYYGFIECSLNGQFLNYINNKEYPHIAEDMANSYIEASKFPVEVFLSSHGVFFGLKEKYMRTLNQGSDDTNPYIDPIGYQNHVLEFRETFERTLKAQMTKSGRINTEG